MNNGHSLRRLGRPETQICNGRSQYEEIEFLPQNFRNAQELEYQIFLKVEWE